MKPSLWRRALASVGLQPLAKREQFAGAKISRLMNTWARYPLSADRELEQDFRILRGRARDTARNNPFGKRFVRACRAHIVGHCGVKLEPTVTFANGEPYETLNDTIEEAWEDWAKPQHCTTNKRLGWVGLQRLVVSEWASCGEALVVIRYGKQYKYGFALQPIDADRLDDQFSLARDARKGQNEVRFGVELDEAGAPVAYHILDHHPADISSIAAREQFRRRIPAEQVIHLYRDDERVELTRGVPDLAIALRDLRHLDGFQEAALIKMRTAAAAMGFITTKGPDAEPTTPEEGLEFAAEAGMIRELGMGQEFQGWDPSEPATSYPEFVKAILRSIASGLGISYNQLANDLSDANYSSMRVGRAEEQETWKELQSWFIAQFCERVYDVWIRMAVLSGAVPAASQGSRDITAHEFTGRRWAAVDPVKEVEAYERRVALGIDSRKNIAAQEGGDFYETIDDLTEEEAYAESHGIDIGPPRAGGVTGNGPNPTEDAADAASANAAGSGRGRVGEPRRGRQPHPDFAVVRSAR